MVSPATPPPRIVVITDEVVTEPVAAPAIRAWELARALSAGHDVVLATTSPVCERAGDGFATEAAGAERLAELEAWCDVVVLHAGLVERASVFKTTDKVMVVDLHDPLFLEDLERKRSWPEPDRTAQSTDVVRVFDEQIRRGDFFLCASDQQRDMWLGFLSSVGRVNPATYGQDPTLRQLIDVVPFGRPAPLVRFCAAPSRAADFVGTELVADGGGVLRRAVLAYRRGGLRSVAGEARRAAVRRGGRRTQPGG